MEVLEDILNEVNKLKKEKHIIEYRFYYDEDTGEILQKYSWDNPNNNLPSGSYIVVSKEEYKLNTENYEVKSGNLQKKPRERKYIFIEKTENPCIVKNNTCQYKVKKNNLYYIDD